MIPRLAIVAIGTEVTEGRIANTNAAWIARRFLRLGIETACHIAVPDDREEMRRAFAGAASRAGLVIVTGGLGPTIDDLTRDVAAEVAGVPLEEDPESLERIEAIFRMLGRTATPNNRRQALFPRGATVLKNDFGTAPGFRIALAGADFIFVPGVPHECERMLEGEVIPALEREWATGGVRPAVLVRRLNSFGLPESKVDAILAPLLPGPEPLLGLNTSDGVIQIYLTSRAAAREEAEARLGAAAARVREALGPSIFAEGERSLEETLVDLLRERKLTIGLAESCTGGLAASRLARVPGASDVFLGGVVAYSNDVKRRLLSVPAKVLERHGAVSLECARAMARGALAATGASVAAAITGIAGPGGGSAEKPVGLVFVAVAGEGIDRAREVRLGRNREWVQRLSALGALDQVRRAVLGLPETTLGK